MAGLPAIGTIVSVGPVLSPRAPRSGSPLAMPVVHSMSLPPALFAGHCRLWSPDAGGRSYSRPVQFSGRHLFVNGDFRSGQLKVEVLDRSGSVIAPFTADACVPVSGDGTRLAVTWNAASLGDLAGRRVRFRFTMTAGRLFAFWVSATPSGESGGYPAAGGPEFSGPIDARR